MLHDPGRPIAFLKGGLAPWQVRKVRDHIRANIDRPINVTQLAGLVDLSPSYFSRAFQLSTGKSPHAYVTRQRLEYAASLMLASSAPLAVIATSCGLCDQAHLTRLFQRHLQETPANWRRRTRTCGAEAQAG